MISALGCAEPAAVFRLHTQSPRKTCMFAWRSRWRVDARHDMDMDIQDLLNPPLMHSVVLVLLCSWRDLRSHGSWGTQVSKSCTCAPRATQSIKVVSAGLAPAARQVPSSSARLAHSLTHGGRRAARPMSSTSFSGLSACKETQGRAAEG